MCSRGGGIVFDADDRYIPHRNRRRWCRMDYRREHQGGRSRTRQTCPRLGPEEIHREHPHLSLAQIHSAFAYYYENQEKMDGEIDRREHEAEEIARQAADPALRRKLLDLKKQLSAEGTEVRVEPRGPKTLAEHFKGVIGTVHGGPPDWAKNHDHYIHGTPKK